MAKLSAAEQDRLFDTLEALVARTIEVLRDLRTDLSPTGAGH